MNKIRFDIVPEMPIKRQLSMNIQYDNMDSLASTLSTFC